MVTCAHTVIIVSGSAVPVLGSSGDIMNAPMNINGKESLWIDRGWRAADTDKDTGTGAKLLLDGAGGGGGGGGGASSGGSGGSASTGSSSMQHSAGNYIDAGTDYAEVDTRNFSSFYNPCKQVSLIHSGHADINHHV